MEKVWLCIGGVVFGALSASQLWVAYRRGKVLSGYGGRFTKTEDPIYFWFVVIIHLSVVVIVIVGLFAIVFRSLMAIV